MAAFSLAVITESYHTELDKVKEAKKFGILVSHWNLWNSLTYKSKTGHSEEWEKGYEQGIFIIKPSK